MQLVLVSFVVLRRVHAPVFDVDVELRQVEVGPDQVAFGDAEAFVVDVGDLLGGIQSVRNTSACAPSAAS